MKVSRQPGGHQLNTARRVLKPSVRTAERSLADAVDLISLDPASAMANAGRTDSSSCAGRPPAKRWGRRPRRKVAKGLHVLIAEDDALIAFLLGEMLAEMGHDVCAIEATEAGAIDAALRCNPDLIIVDVLLEFGSGVSAMREIRRTRPVPFVFTTGDVAGAAALGFGAIVIQKPFDEVALTAAIRRAVAERS
jgi:two-component system, response regulator PdtaR